MDKPYCKPQIWGGIECTINRVQDRFFDQLQYAGHYRRTSDAAALSALGIKKMRYPVLWEKHQPERTTEIDWKFTTEQLLYFKQQNIDVIAGLVHHGSGPAFTHLLDPQFPYLLAQYAAKVAKQFPWLQYYTPVNEPLTTARFSGLYGLWYPHKKSSRLFLRMLLHQLKGVVLSMQEIRKINPAAQLVQTEDLGKTYSTPRLQYQAQFENERRWLTYDILSGRLNQSHPLWQYFIDLQIPEHELNFFKDNVCEPDVFGFNHYVTSERFLDEALELYPSHTHGSNGQHQYADVEAVRVHLHEETGLKVLLQEAWNRYGKPMAITEAHLHCHREEQVRWFKYVWDVCNQLCASGVIIKGVTAWALLGSFGWDKLLTGPAGTYEPGAFDLRSGILRHTALAGFLKSLNANCKENVPVFGEKGWWQRSSRVIYGCTPTTPLNVSGANQQPVLIIGKNGTLGRAFARVCKNRCIPFILLSRQDCNISRLQEIEAVIKKYRPLAIINAAGYVRVDDAESDCSNCYNDNTTGAYNLAVACSQHGVQLITFSSDLVFDGLKTGAYVESDPTNPVNVYGKSKAESERLVQQHFSDALIIRTSAFFGPWDAYNFAYWVQRSLQQFQAVKVANNVSISPTYVPDLVHATLDLLIDKENGIWHLANAGKLTWADFAYRVAEAFELDASFIDAVPWQAAGFVAARPENSVLTSERGTLLPSFDDALNRYIAEKSKEEKQQFA